MAPERRSEQSDDRGWAGPLLVSIIALGKQIANPTRLSSSVMKWGYSFVDQHSFTNVN